MLSDLVLFWKNVLSELTMDYKKEVQLLTSSPQISKISNWNDFYIKVRDCNINYYNFDNLFQIDLDDGVAYRECEDILFNIKDDELYIEITMDFSKKVFQPVSKEPIDYSRSTMFPRISGSVYSFGRSYKRSATYDFKIIGYDYFDDGGFVKKISGKKFGLSDAELIRMLNINLLLRESVVKFIEERDTIYDNEKYPKNLANKIRYSFKNYDSAKNDSFLKNSHRKKCVALDFMELDLMINAYHSFVKNNNSKMP